MGGGNERLRHEHSLRAAETRICDAMGLWPSRTRGKVANMDAKIPVRANTKRCGCEIIRAGHRPLASICPMVPYTLH